jgi:alpha-ketoglutarate-dependent taurine dioxygenase
MSLPSNLSCPFCLPAFEPGVSQQNLTTTNQSHIVSQRGVVFLRGQSSLTVEMQKEFIDLLGKLSGRPATSGLHVHPLIEGKRDVGVNEKNEFDEKISVISSQLSQKLDSKSYGERYTNAKKGWHSEFVLIFIC